MGSTFDRIEAQVRALDRRGAKVKAWKAACPVLAASPVKRASDVPEWVWGLGHDDTDEVLRVLVSQAQARDEVAMLVVLMCLRPGLTGLAGRQRVPLDEVVSVASACILSVRLEGRHRVASGLMFDTRRVLWLENQRDERLEELADPHNLLMYEQMLLSDTGDGSDVSPSEELMAGVLEAWRAGRLSQDEAGLIIETRVMGNGRRDAVETAARRRGVSCSTAYVMRDRAERRLAAFLRRL